MSFFSDFSGASAKRDLQVANKRAGGFLQQGYNDQKAGYADAIDDFDPYVTQGQAGNAMYNDAIGINGVDKRDALVQQYVGTADPFAKFNEDNSIRAINRNANASGQFGSGVAALAAARSTQEHGTANWNQLLDRWNGVGQTGLQATGAQTGIKTANADNAFNYGATRAGQATNFGNAMAASRSTLTNNLLGVAGVAAKFANPAAAGARA